MKKILFAIDDTKTCQKAASFIVDFFGKDERFSITLVHVKTPIMLYGEAALAAYEEIENKESKESSKLLEKFVDIFRNNNIDVTSVMLEGEAVEEVLECSKDYDLLAIGHSESSIWNSIFSSNQSSFSEKSPIPILIVK